MGENTGKQREPAKKIKIIAFISTFGGLLFGYDTGVINGALPYMSRADQLNLTPFTEGLVASSLLLGAAFGALFGGQLSDRHGRRRNIMFLALLFFGATLGCTLASDTTLMVIFRFLLGLAVGGASVTVPTFLAEMAPAEKRGQIVTQNEFMIVTGQFLAFTFNAILGNTLGEVGHVWRYMLVIASLPAVILWFGMLIVPESPRWLASKGRIGEALKVLKQIRKEKQANEELTEIKKSIAKESKMKKATIKDLSTPWIRRILFLGIGIAVVNQINGVNAIMYYGTEILKDAGLGIKAALIGNVANGIISMGAMLVGIWLLGKVNRRPMLIIGLCGTTTSLFLIGFFSMLLEGSPALPYVVLSLTVLFLAFMKGAIGPVTWLTLAEIFPLGMRGLGMGFSVFWMWIVNFSISLTFPMLLASIGLAMTFFIFAILGVFAIAFVHKYLPETRGYSLEEIEQHFRSYDDEAVHSELPRQVKQ
ncbi:sugar porter family MFS transporter [Priestia filamentosa]|uniref:sugar porter family MFS transporter n=1 Tax=Priestia filamentosa TaxID=1402861 RepID=UPI0002F00845|nr:sugar porter family MFS transporter [Priestia filamentosa]